MSEKAIKCAKEIDEVLKKHDCILVIEFTKSNVLGKEVLIYEPVIKDGTSTAGVNQE